MKETIQDVLQLILQADDIKYVKNSGILNYGLDLKQVVEREIELSVCKGDKEILLAMNYDIEQCSVQFQIVDCTEEDEKSISSEAAHGERRGTSGDFCLRLQLL